MDKDRFIGRLLDSRYEILEVIGTGGMAIVYKARDHRLNRLVAIKLLRDDYRQDDEFRRRFHAESQAVAMLSNPNIVSVYDVSATTEADYIVMELIDGISLKQYMAKKGVLNWKETLHFAIQIAKALEHAHSRGIVHRDIKPHNVMVLKNGSVKVTDFGIARIMSKSNTLTKEALGSVHYISPEQAKGGRVDNRSDIYSLGVVMYEMMTGRPPFDGDSPVSVAIQHISGGAAMPSTLNPNIPGGLEQIIMKAMALDPNQRYATATEMLYDMDELRKNPSVLFDYNLGGRAYVPPVQSVQDRVTPPRQDTGRVRRDTGVQHRVEEPETEEPRNKITIAAIIACSAVAVVAIAIILVMWFSNSVGNNRETLVNVPRLIGKVYEELPVYTDISVQLQDRSYSDEYEKGQIMDQRPEAGSQVVQGADVYVVVSMGAEPEVFTMENLVELQGDNAKSFLEDLGLNLRILFREETSNTIKEGRVTRTEPAEGEELSQGQTVTLWISTGPGSAAMPNVVGMDVSAALDVLRASGFTNVDYEPEDSDRPKNEVVRQSEKRGNMVDVTAKIFLYVSAGPAETTAPTTEPTTAPTEPTTPPTEPTTPPTEPEVTKTIQLTLPNREEAYTLTIKLDGEPVTDSAIIAPGTSSMPVQLTGRGIQYFELYIDDKYYATEKVDFTPNG